MLATDLNAGPCWQPDRLLARLARLADGNPCAADPTPLVLALIYPDPARHRGPAALRMVVAGQWPRTDTTEVRLAEVQRPVIPIERRVRSRGDSPGHR